MLNNSQQLQNITDGRLRGESMDKQQKQVIERLENIVYLYNRESRGWYDCNDIRLNSNDIKAIEKAIELVKAIPSAEPYKGMTNGQVHDMLYQMLVELKDGADRYGAEK